MRPLGDPGPHRVPLAGPACISCLRCYHGAQPAPTHHLRVSEPVTGD